MNAQQFSPAQDRHFNDPLERALYILQDAIMIINRKRLITYLNGAVEEAARKQFIAKPAVGDHYMDFIEPERLEETEVYIEDAFCNRPTSFRLKFVHEGKDNWYQIGYYPMPDDSGFVTHVCVRARNITDQVMLEKELEAEKEKQRNRVIKAVLDAQEKQRSEIGRELHDNVNQVLTTVKLYNELALTEELTNKNLLLRSVQQVNYCIETLRTLSKTLSSPDIEEIDLKDSISELVEEFNTTRRINARFISYGIQKERISQDLQTTLYRIVQEQLTNVLKYADASQVDVLLVGTSDTIALRIEDNGVGFDQQQKSRGVGITNMLSRVEALGGEFEIVSSPGNGCSLMAEFTHGS